MKDRLAKINLNLLVSLKIIIEEKNINLAADRLCITPSAMSKSLRRLRNLLDDQIVTSTKEGLQLTLFAEELTPKLDNILVNIDEMLYKDNFDPAKASGKLRLALPESLAIYIVPELVSYFKKTKSDLELETHTLMPDYVDYICNNKLDYCLTGGFRKTKLLSTLVGQMRPIILVSKKSLLAKYDAITLEMIRDHQLIINTAGNLQQSKWAQDYENLITNLGANIILNTSQLSVSLEMLHHHDVLMLTSESAIFLNDFKARYKMFPVPDGLLPSEKLDQYLYYYHRTENASMHNWFVELIKSLIKNINSTNFYKKTN